MALSTVAGSKPTWNLVSRRQVNLVIGLHSKMESSACLRIDDVSQ